MCVVFVSQPCAIIYDFPLRAILLVTMSSLDGEQLSDLQKEALFISSSSLSDHVPIGKGKCIQYAMGPVCWCVCVCVCVLCWYVCTMLHN